MIRVVLHDISSSGSTVFIEPTSVFDMNNEMNTLKIREGIEIERLDRIMDHCGSLAKVEGIGAGASFLLALGGIALTAVCPVAGPNIALFCLGGSLGCGAVTAGCGIVAAGAKIAKEIKK